MQRSKTYRAAEETFDRDELYSPLTAIKIAKDASKKKFDETVDVVMRLGVDPRKADQMVRGTVNLPHGTGKTARVLVFANAEKADAAREAGADVVGGDELIEKVSGGWLDFDAVVATPDMMGKVGRLGRVLGPRGLMPNPKTGTVTPDVVLILATKSYIVARHHLMYGGANAEHFKDWSVLTVEKNRSGSGGAEIEFKKRFDQGRFDPDGNVVTEKLVDERVYVE